MAPNQEQRGSKDGPGQTEAAVPVGALSALLGELAQAPPAEAGAGLAWPRPGTVIARFELRREIGRGGFGVVYEARDQQLLRSVAFKLVRPGRLEHGLEQLGREAEVIASLSHPNLVTLFDVGRCEYGPYLVLELLRGDTLERRLRGEPVPVAEALGLAVEVARGLAHAHAQGVVHRDLKPSNVFLGQGGAVKLLDFGMAHAFGHRRVDGGTPGYMAPEQWRGAPEDERTDVFALGIMLYRMIAGELPFPHQDGGKEIASGRPAALLDIPEAPGLAALLARMLAKDPTDRPRDGGEVAAELARLAGAPGQPAALSRPAPRRRAMRPRRARWTALAGLVGVAAAAIGYWTFIRPRSHPRARTVAVQPFANLSGAAENAFFSDGLTFEICNLLVRLRELRVSCPPGGGASGPPAPRNVDVLLAGSVRRDRDQVRIGAELVEAGTGLRIWSQVYDRKLSDVFAIQDDIARQVVGALALVLSQASQSALQRPGRPSLTAYDLYLKARSLLRQPHTPATLEQATSLFEQALAADAAFGEARAGLCEAWLARYQAARTEQAYQRGEQACQAAAAGPDSAERQVALGQLRLLAGRLDEAGAAFTRARAIAYDPMDAILGLAGAAEAGRKFDAAEQSLAEAKRLDPEDSRAYRARGNLLFHRGRYAEAAREYAEEIARTRDNASAQAALGAARYMAADFAGAAQAWRTSLQLAPTRSGYSNSGTSLYYLGRFAEAAAEYRKAIEIAPGDPQMWGNLGDALSQLAGSTAEATAAYGRAATLGQDHLRVNPQDAQALADLALYQVALARPAEARELLEKALALEPGTVGIRYEAALVRARLGEPEAALGELERAVSLGYPPQLLAGDPGLLSLRGTARFAALLAPRP